MKGEGGNNIKREKMRHKAMCRNSTEENKRRCER